MAKFIRTSFPEIQHLYSSSATRAMDYAVSVHSHSGVDVQVDEALYTFSGRALLARIHTLPDRFDHIGVVSHNPATTEVLNHLAVLGLKDKVVNVPTSALAVLQFKEDHWANLSAASGELLDFVWPKMVAGQK